MSRRNLLNSMESMARKRQKEFEEVAKWSDQTQYYKNWDRHNSQFQSWTSSNYYKNSLSQYDSLKLEKQRKEDLERRRDRLRKILFEEDQQYELQMQSLTKSYQRSHYKLNETPSEVLKVNIGLKLAENDRKRHEAELKLYQQWKTENSVIRNYESSQNNTDLKLAWLDQQIEKKMLEEQQNKETKELIEERDRLIKEEERLERLELEESTKREQQFKSDIELQIQQYKQKEQEAECVKLEGNLIMKKKQQIEDLIQKNEEELKQRQNREVYLYNINQPKTKLRKKASEIEDQLKKDQQIIEEILVSRLTEDISNSETKNSIKSFLNYVRDQKNLENQRQQFISIIFDSEAKSLWQKQDKQWKEEQQSRERLLQDLLKCIQSQIEDKFNRNLAKQRDLLSVREEMLQRIEDQNNLMKKCSEDVLRKKK